MSETRPVTVPASLADSVPLPDGGVSPQGEPDRSLLMEFLVVIFRLFAVLLGALLVLGGGLFGLCGAMKSNATGWMLTAVLLAATGIGAFWLGVFGMAPDKPGTDSSTASDADAADDQTTVG